MFNPLGWAWRGEGSALAVLLQLVTGDTTESHPNPTTRRAAEATSFSCLVNKTLRRDIDVGLEDKTHVHLSVMCFSLPTTPFVFVATLLQSKTIQYIGVSRGIQQSLRLHLARRPTQTYFFKVMHQFSTLFGVHCYFAP